MAADKQPRDFASIARRVTDWTTKSLLTALILVAGLGFGRQVLRWWAADRTKPAAASTPVLSDALGDPWQPHVLQFGDQPWSLRRQSISGDQAAAMTALQQSCRQCVAASAPASAKPSEAECRFLASLSKLKPSDEQPGKWQLYELPYGFPMVVGVRPPPPGAGGQLAETPRRVVIWGLAMPAGAQTWTVLVFQPDSDAGGPIAAPSGLPIPPDSRRLVAMQAADGGAIVAFAGSERPEVWKQFYTDWFARHGWKATEKWRPTGSSWHAQYTAAAAVASAAVADISLSSDVHGQNTGLLTTSISGKQSP
jgi:hypothetical protein